MNLYNYIIRRVILRGLGFGTVLSRAWTCYDVSPYRCQSSRLGFVEPGTRKSSENKNVVVVRILGFLTEIEEEKKIRTYISDISLLYPQEFVKNQILGSKIQWN